MPNDEPAARSEVDREIELPAGVVRVAPLEATVEGTIVMPSSEWNGQAVEGLSLQLRHGRIVQVTAASGK